MSEYHKLTQAELLELARQRFGDDPMAYAFRCTSCGDVASIADFITANADPGRAGQECIGRSLGALDKPKATNTRGCDWTAYGLIPGPWEIVLPADGDKPERSVRSFPLADAPAQHPIDPRWNRGTRLYECQRCGKPVEYVGVDAVSWRHTSPTGRPVLAGPGSDAPRGGEVR